jgi:hypothetical protein
MNEQMVDGPGIEGNAGVAVISAIFIAIPIIVAIGAVVFTPTP